MYVAPLEEHANEYRWQRVYAHDVFAIVKCVNPECSSTKLQTRLVNVLEERNLHPAFGCGTISELWQLEFHERRTKHRCEEL